MPISIEKLSPEASEGIFARASFTPETLQPYIDAMKARELAPGDTVKVTVSGDSTARQARKRLNAAAATFGYKLGWREKDKALYFRVTAQATKDAKLETPEQKPDAKAA